MKLKLILKLIKLIFGKSTSHPLLGQYLTTMKMIFCKNTFLPQFFDWWQVSATVEVTKGLVLASEITIVNVT